MARERLAGGFLAPPHARSPDKASRLERRKRPNPRQIAGATRTRARLRPANPDQAIPRRSRGQGLVAGGLGVQPGEERRRKAAGDEHLAHDRQRFRMGLGDVLGLACPPPLAQPDLHLGMGDEVLVPVGPGAEAGRAVDVPVDQRVVDRRGAAQAALAPPVHQDHHLARLRAIPEVAQAQPKEQEHEAVTVFEHLPEAGVGPAQVLSHGGYKLS